MKIVAEIGCNHKGDIEIAKNMIQMAAIFCQVDQVKFQKRTVDLMKTDEVYLAAHDNPIHAYGDSYLAHRHFLELSLEEHLLLQAFAKQLQIEYSSSVWDLQAAKEISSLQPSSIKIPSACNTNLPMVTWLLENFYGEIHISLGMTSYEEEEKIIRLAKEYNRIKDIILYACTSAYPVEAGEVYLREITRLLQTYGNQVKGVGFSGHHHGIALDMGAIALGATIIERHFTLDRTWKGTDHAASLEPDGLRRLKRDAMKMMDALHYKPTDILEVEKSSREKLKWRDQ